MQPPSTCSIRPPGPSRASSRRPSALIAAADGRSFRPKMPVFWRQDATCLSKSCGGREHFIKDVEESAGHLSRHSRTHDGAGAYAATSRAPSAV
ncbi:MAG: hypothetical protein ACLUNV_08510 [Sutterella wadsworthensis]